MLDHITYYIILAEICGNSTADSIFSRKAIASLLLIYSLNHILLYRFMLDKKFISSLLANIVDLIMYLNYKTV